MIDLSLTGNNAADYFLFDFICSHTITEQLVSGCDAEECAAWWLLHKHTSEASDRIRFRIRQIKPYDLDERTYWPPL
jgi:hypothetical protein